MMALVEKVAVVLMAVGGIGETGVEQVRTASQCLQMESQRGVFTATIVTFSDMHGSSGHFAGCTDSDFSLDFSESGIEKMENSEVSNLLILSAVRTGGPLEMTVNAIFSANRDEVDRRVLLIKHINSWQKLVP